MKGVSVAYQTVFEVFMMEGTVILLKVISQIFIFLKVNF
jgi:hypothetical protein